MKEMFRAFHTVLWPVHLWSVRPWRGRESSLRAGCVRTQRCVVGVWVPGLVHEAVWCLLLHERVLWVVFVYCVIRDVGWVHEERIARIQRSEVVKVTEFLEFLAALAVGVLLAAHDNCIYRNEDG